MKITEDDFESCVSQENGDARLNGSRTGHGPEAHVSLPGLAGISSLEFDSESSRVLLSRYLWPELKRLKLSAPLVNQTLQDLRYSAPKLSFLTVSGLRVVGSDSENMTFPILNTMCVFLAEEGSVSWNVTVTLFVTTQSRMAKVDAQGKCRSGRLPQVQFYFSGLQYWMGPRAVEVDFSGNELTLVPDIQVLGCSHAVSVLIRLNLADNRLQSTEMVDVQKTKAAGGCFVYIHTVDLSHNDLREGEEDQFLKQTELRELYLHHNNYADLPRHSEKSTTNTFGFEVYTLNDLKKLEFLDMSHNCLDVARLSFFLSQLSPHTALQKVDFSHCNLTHMVRLPPVVTGETYVCTNDQDWVEAAGTTKTLVVDLGFNLISSLGGPPGPIEFPLYSSLIKCQPLIHFVVDMKGNPLNCSDSWTVGAYEFLVSGSKSLVQGIEKIHESLLGDSRQEESTSPVRGLPVPVDVFLYPSTGNQVRFEVVSLQRHEPAFVLSFSTHQVQDNPVSQPAHKLRRQSPHVLVGYSVDTAKSDEAEYLLSDLRNKVLNTNDVLVSDLVILKHIPINLLTTNFTFFSDNLKCANPPEWNGIPVTEVPEVEFSKLYSDQLESLCPAGCCCYHSWRLGDVEVANCTPTDSPPLTNFPVIQGQTYIILSHNALQELCYQHLANKPEPSLSNIYALDASRNNLHSVCGNLFSELANANYLNLGYNKITKLPSQIEEMISLRVLDLTGAGLQELPQELENMVSLVKIGLGGNMFRCDCDTFWMRSWLSNNTKIIRDAHSLLCFSGKGKGKRIIELTQDDVGCYDPLKNKRDQLQKLLLIFSGTFVFFSCLVSVLYKYKGHIKVWLYTHLNIHPWDNVKENIDEKDFDALVSFYGADPDRHWVCKTLLPYLEAPQCGFHLCVHQRDFVPTATICENITQAIKYSRRTILVLSPNFVQSGWCDFEFQNAHRRVLEDRSNFLIVVLLAEVNKETLDKTLKLYLDTKTYLDMKDNNFWNKLLYCMPTVPIDKLKTAQLNPQQNDPGHHETEPPMPPKGSLVDDLALPPLFKRIHTYQQYERKRRREEQRAEVVVEI